MFRVLILIMLLFTAGCATVSRMPAAVDSQSLEELCSKYTLDCVWDGVAQAITLHYRGQRVQAMVGSNVVLTGDVKIVLSAPLERRRGAVIVPVDFERLIFVQPFSGGGTIVPDWRLGKVVVDAGHGAKDPGAIGFHGIKEKVINLDVAQRIAKGLRAEGVEVIETRDRDVFLSLAERTAVASRPGVDLFISVHSNASKSRHAHGFEVYASGVLSAQDRADEQRRENGRKLCGLLNMRKDSGDLRAVVADMLYVTKLNETPRLATMISHNLAETLGQNFRGSTKLARYYVLRNTLIPSVLIEVGFITNPKEAIQLKEPAYRQKIADAVVQGVMRCTYGTGM